LTAAPATATIVVSLPADAKLSVEDHPTKAMSERRTLVSTPLETGRQYYYTLKAEITRDGKPITETRRVIVEAGRETQVKFDFDTSLAQR
jgi:uncharacterized protein (TIGR03000 family)